MSISAYMVKQGSVVLHLCNLGWQILAHGRQPGKITISCELREHARTCDMCRLPDPADNNGRWIEEEDCGSDPEEQMDDWED